LKLAADLSCQVSEQLIIRANELYHDAENARYDERHKLWHQAEAEFYRSLAGRYLSRGRPICCLDYGSGTGFVPLAIAPCLQPDDSLICVDLSEDILKACKSKLAAAGLPCRVSYLKTDGRTIDVHDRSVDVVTVNSVLHHLYDLRPFAAECTRILKDDGVIVVAHEPNRDRRLPLGGRVMYGFAIGLLKPSTLVYGLVDRSTLLERGLRRFLSSVSDSWSRRNRMLRDIAMRLQQEKMVDRELRGVEIQQLIDYHTQFGFTRKKLLEEVFQGYRIMEWRTYNHLGELSGKNMVSRAISTLMQDWWPLSGHNLAFVLQKGY
jgi:ubiquinone/menaquinone biosynthesis C-methylase UbiE